jgi:hypothetical protein
MSNLSSAMGELVEEVRFSAQARRAGLKQLRSCAHGDLDRFRRERHQMFRQARQGARKQLAEIRETANGLRQAVRSTLNEIASDVSAAKRLWSVGPELTTTVLERPFEAPPAEERLTEQERILQVLKAHPDGIRLVDIGNQLGVDWRGLIAPTKSLLDEGKVEKIDYLYYLAADGTS